MKLVKYAQLPHDNTHCQQYRTYFDKLIEIYVYLLEHPDKMNILKQRLKEANVLCRSC